MNRTAIEPIRKLSSETEIEGVRSGFIADIDAEGKIWIDFSGNRYGPMRARLTTTVAGLLAEQSDIKGKPVLIAFVENDVKRPVVMDMIQDRIAPPDSELTVNRNELDDVHIDGETVTFDAKKEIVLRCGKSSITLTRAGKVLIRGAYLLNRSSGVNRIKGGSVQIN